MIGWKAGRRISDQLVINNADNFGFFGLGARMISPKDKDMIAVRPMENGTVQILPAK